MRTTITSAAIVAASFILISACNKAPTPPTQPPASGTGTTVESLESVTARAEAGDVNAQFELGAIYHDGQSVTKDLKVAREWFEKAAAQNDSRAQFNLGVMDYTGEDGDVDYASARTWFEKAAKQGNLRAQFNLGVIYYRGEGTKVDFAKALDYFTKAGSMGFAEAEFNLGVMHAKGEGTDVDIVQAYTWLSAAQTFGSDKAAAALQELGAGMTDAQIAKAKDDAEKMTKEINDRIQKALKAGQEF